MQLGFTLIEFLIVVAIMGLFSAMAITSYQEVVSRSRRADAQATLLEAAQFMERFYTEHGRYDRRSDGVAIALPTHLTASPKDSQTKYYNLSLSAVAQETYSLQAVPAQGYPDSACGTLTLTDKGVKGAAGTACWR